MSNSVRRPWTRDELILAINLYCKTPFGRIHIRNPEIIALAKELGRTPGAVSYKLANFSALDPSLDRKGAVHGSKLDREVWNEFFENWEGMVLESEKRMAALSHSSKPFDVADEAAPKEGATRDSLVKVRINQAFFRKVVLSSYNEICCITGIDNVELLIASHIIPWSRDVKNRLNPMNGLCLNALHDRAFDQGLITIDERYQVVVAQKVKHALFLKYANTRIRLPERFYPDKKFLEFHRNEIFQG